MKKEEIVVVVQSSVKDTFTFDKLCEMCGAPPDFIQELISYEIIHPQGTDVEDWLFDLHHLQRIQTALRLQHDLEVNLPGIALVLDLLDELEDLRTKTKILEKHFR